MQDSNLRNINYMRLSITDKCNLRCKYCMPKENNKFLDTNSLMSFAEVQKIAIAMAKLGIVNIKITGGEPLLRGDVGNIVKMLKEVEGIKKVSITTNGVLLNRYIDDFTYANIDGINISLDTVDENKCKEITNRNNLNVILENINLCIEKGIKNLKLNCVPLKELGEDNLIELIKYAEEKSITLRFIEMMPIGLGRQYESYNYNEILEIISHKFGQYREVDLNISSGPAKYFKFDNLNINIGIIAALSNKFCENCNRIRITCDGKLKQCLNYNYNIDLKGMLNEGVSLEEIKQFIYIKPKEHAFEKVETIQEDNVENKNMSEIGG